jgi:hypothetical protein
MIAAIGSISHFNFRFGVQILRSQIAVILRRRAFVGDTSGVRRLSVSDFATTVSSRTHFDDAADMNFSPAELDSEVNLAPFMNP